MFISCQSPLRSLAGSRVAASNISRTCGRLACYGYVLFPERNTCAIRWRTALPPSSVEEVILIHSRTEQISQKDDRPTGFVHSPRNERSPCERSWRYSSLQDTTIYVHHSYFQPLAEASHSSVSDGWLKEDRGKGKIELSGLQWTRKLKRAPIRVRAIEFDQLNETRL